MNRRSLGLLIAIAILSIFLRVAVALYLGDVVDAPPLLTDQLSYHSLGVRLITGYGFSFDRDWYPFTLAGQPTAHWSFLYSMFVAAAYGLFGTHPLAVRLVQAVMGGALLPAVVYALTFHLLAGTPESEDARSVDHAATGRTGRSLAALPLLAALMAACYGYFILYAATLMTETFFICALLWSLVEALYMMRSPSLLRGLRLGLVLGICVLLRQSILPWLAVLAIWLLWNGRRTGAFRRTLSASAVCFFLITLLVLPFTLRNYRAYGSFLLLNSNAGYAMYSAQHPMHGTTFQPFAAAPVPEELRGWNEAQLDRELMRRGLEFVVADPVRYLKLSFSRIAAYFDFWPSGKTSPLFDLGRVASIGLLLPLLIYGSYIALRYRATPPAGRAGSPFDGRAIAFLLTFMALYSLLHIATWAMPRYRLPFDAAGLPLASLGALDLARRLGLAHLPSRAPKMVDHKAPWR